MEKEAAEDQNRAGQPQRGRNEIRGGAVRILAVFRHLLRRICWNHYGFHHRDPEQHRPNASHGILYRFQYHGKRFQNFRRILRNSGSVVLQPGQWKQQHPFLFYSRYFSQYHAVQPLAEHHLLCSGAGEEEKQPGLRRIGYDHRQDLGRRGAFELRQFFGGRRFHQPFPAGDGVQRRLRP